nr:hypothetical protein HmN_000757900 [Hymenolepis microstoma]
MNIELFEEIHQEVGEIGVEIKSMNGIAEEIPRYILCTNPDKCYSFEMKFQDKNANPGGAYYSPPLCCEKQEQPQSILVDNWEDLTINQTIEASVYRTGKEDVFTKVMLVSSLTEQECVSKNGEIELEGSTRLTSPNPWSIL